MATIILRPSTSTRSSNTSLSNVTNIWDGNDSTYAVFSHTTNGTSIKYLFLNKFDFSSIPEGVQITSAIAVVKISTEKVSSSDWVPEFCTDIATTLSVGTFYPAITDSSHVSSATMTAQDFATFKSYGDDAGIRIPIKRSVIFQKATENIYEVYIEVTYSTEPIPTGTNDTRVGDLTPTKYYVGSNEVDKIYQGSSLIYEK